MIVMILLDCKKLALVTVRLFFCNRRLFSHTLKLSNIFLSIKC